jgi:hypothetical protein
MAMIDNENNSELDTICLAYPRRLWFSSGASSDLVFD